MPSQINVTPIRLTDANGHPVPRGKVSFYEKGTTTPLTVYADEALSVAHPLTITADAEGILPAIWTSGTPAAKMDATDADGVQLNGYPMDPVPLIPSSGSAAELVTFNPVTGNAGTNVQEAIENLTGNWNDVTELGEDLIEAANAAAARSSLGLSTTATAPFLDEDGMSSNSATSVASQQSIKAYVDNSLARGTASAVTTSGTSVDISTAIPAGVTWVDVMFSGVSLSGANDVLVQLSTGSSFVTTGYTSTSTRAVGAALAQADSSAGYVVNLSGAANEARGILRLRRTDDTNFRWISDHTVRLSTTATSTGAGELNLGGTLDGLRVSATASNTFDAGTVYLRWGK